jgi:hypothetical protein
MKSNARFRKELCFRAGSRVVPALCLIVTEILTTIIRMETVYVSLCSHLDDAVKTSDSTAQNTEESLLHLALRMCRKHGLVKDRITLLSPSDFLQVVQLCYAQVLKKVSL